MIIAVLNLSGNTCKTTNTQTLLLPRISNCDVVRIESLNNDGKSIGEKVSGKEWGTIQELLHLNDNVILDIGSSNISSIIEAIKKDQGSEEIIDYFIIPTVPEEKQIADTISTIILLVELGVELEKIRLILNKVDPEITNDMQFNQLITTCREIGICLDNAPRIEHTQLFELLSKTKQSMQECLSDETDFKSLLKDASKQAIAARKDGDTEKQEIERKKISVLTIKQSTQRIAKRQNALYDIEFKKLNIQID
ncbi:hypothetical protein TUM4438_41360 [Shewanella sairae]|uniref:ParA family protein n=1 Tax=Shewanella sairae TaxID=190310 RepID=A0ABQ4PQK9_9GAMM|nr:hypothetical protein [Shewanella sairae]MCL1132340.1 hypothetical protein [Shewanella sairae]GIU51504.1 hypothetical protein TUM4438_41360 [Shewanella sairae]